MKVNYYSVFGYSRIEIFKFVEVKFGKKKISSSPQLSIPTVIVSDSSNS